MEDMRDEIGDDRSIRGRTNAITPILRQNNLPSSQKQPKPPKPKTVTEIPRFLMKVSSSLFKKATAAEIFMNHMEKQKKALGTISNKQKEKNILKVTEESRAERSHIVQNLMSEPSTLPKPGRRKSIEVLMADKSMTATHGKVTRLDPQPSLIKGKKEEKKTQGDKSLAMKSEIFRRDDEIADKHIPEEDHGDSKCSNPENLCTVCFCKEPNTVFMPCGHGGICDDCALGIFEKSDQCPFCRKVSGELL